MSVSEKLNEFIKSEGNGSTRDALNVALARLEAAEYAVKELQRLVNLMEPAERDGGFNIPGLATLNGPRRALAQFHEVRHAACMFSEKNQVAIIGMKKTMFIEELERAGLVVDELEIDRLFAPFIVPQVKPEDLAQLMNLQVKTAQVFAEARPKHSKKKGRGNRRF